MASRGESISEVYKGPARSPRAARTASRAAAAAGALALALAGCSRGDAAGRTSDTAPGLEPRERPRVRVEAVAREEMVRVLETTTEVESEAEIELPARRAGLVVELLAEEGDRIESGEVLARLDVREQENAVREAEIALREARESKERLVVARRESEERQLQLALAEDQRRRDHDRNERLFADESVASALSEKDLEASRLAYDDSVAQRKQADLSLERARLDEAAADTAIDKSQVALDRANLELSYGAIVARFDGVVAERHCRLGQELAAGARAFTLTDPARLRAVFFRPQAELPAFAAGAGLELTATAEAAPGAVFRGEILRTSPTVDAASGNFRVTASMDPLPEDPAEEAPRLLPGMLVRLRVVTDRHPYALVVSKRSLRREGDEVFVLVVEDGVLRRVPVAEGYAGDERAEVLPIEPGELAEGDLVVLVGSRELEDGAEVEIDPEDNAEIDAEIDPENDAEIGETAGSEREAPPAAAESG